MLSQKPGSTTSPDNESLYDFDRLNWRDFIRSNGGGFPVDLCNTLYIPDERTRDREQIILDDLREIISDCSRLDSHKVTKS
jgi:hypothetical protein